MNKLQRRMLLALCAAVVLAAGCKANTSASAEPTPTPTPTPAPRLTAAPGKVPAPTAQRFAGYEVRIKPVKGPTALLTEPIAAQLLLDTAATTRLRVEGANAKFGNDIEVVSPDSGSRFHYKAASDGQLLMQDDYGQVFRMPEYIYYLLEQKLWEVGGTLNEAPLTWDPQTGTQQLETEMPRLLKTAMLPAYGYALGYFCSYKIYGINTSIKDTVKVYMLLMYAGYDLDSTKGVAFLPLFSHTSAAQMVFTRIRGNTWRMTDLRLPAIPKDANQQTVYTSVRKVLPFENMDAYTEDMKDTSALTKDIVRQATEFLRAYNLSGLTIGD